MRGYIHIYIYIYICILCLLFISMSILLRCLAGFCDASPPATRRCGEYSETLVGGQPGPARAAPPAEYDLATRGSGSCGSNGSGGRSQRGAALAPHEIQRRCSWPQLRAVYRACNVPASCPVQGEGRAA